MSSNIGPNIHPNIAGKLYIAAEKTLGKHELGIARTNIIDQIRGNLNEIVGEDAKLAQEYLQNLSELLEVSGHQEFPEDVKHSVQDIVKRAASPSHEYSVSPPSAGDAIERGGIQHHPEEGEAIAAEMEIVDSDAVAQKPKRLMLGEADLSYAVDYAKRHPGEIFIASTYETREVLELKYDKECIAKNISELQDAGIEVLHGVDATTLHEDKRFEDLSIDMLQFNFPHTGSRARGEHTSALVKSFFDSASKKLPEGGMVRMYMVKGTGATRSHYKGQYGKGEAVHQAGFTLERKRKMSDSSEGSYKHQPTKPGKDSPLSPAFDTESSREYSFRKGAKPLSLPYDSDKMTTDDGDSDEIPYKKPD